jgi:hypothetical protein
MRCIYGLDKKKNRRVGSFLPSAGAPSSLALGPFPWQVVVLAPPFFSWTDAACADPFVSLSLSVRLRDDDGETFPRNTIY